MGDFISGLESAFFFFFFFFFFCTGVIFPELLEFCLVVGGDLEMS